METLSSQSICHSSHRFHLRRQTAFAHYANFPTCTNPIRTATQSHRGTKRSIIYAHCSHGWWNRTLPNVMINVIATQSPEDALLASVLGFLPYVCTFVCVPGRFLDCAACCGHSEPGERICILPNTSCASRWDLWRWESHVDGWNDERPGEHTHTQIQMVCRRGDQIRRWRYIWRSSNGSLLCINDDDDDGWMGCPASNRERRMCASLDALSWSKFRPIVTLDCGKK